ncbi:MAG TPA: acyltransferase [Acidimicrobiales bacterium]|nr:acyltransferase [Acidimicrobiales bacterium]
MSTARDLTSTRDHEVAAPRSSFRGDIQGLRALAVLLVVLAHAGVPHFAGGYIGVDVFFVISGYVITGLLLRQPTTSLTRNLKVFYARRIRRIIPAATSVLVATVIATYLWLGPYTGVTLLSDVRWASLFAANWHFIANSSGYFIPGVPPSLVTHYWSLAVEEQFYIVFPLLVFGLGALVGVRRRRVALTITLALAVIVSSWWSIHLSNVNAVQAYYSPFTRFWELALGGLLVLAPRAWTERSPRTNAVLGYLALVVIIVAATRFGDTSVYPGSLAWWPCGATAVLLWTGQSRAKLNSSAWLASAPLQYVGNVSYSFYLWHYLWLMLPLQYATTPMAPLSRVLQVLGAFACAVISYHFFENPIRHSKWLDQKPYRAGVLLVGCLAVTWGVTFIYAAA